MLKFIGKILAGEVDKETVELVIKYALIIFSPVYLLIVLCVVWAIVLYLMWRNA